ncbi:acyl-CoA thioester hydrolase/BAAT C-terminal domain-containing protein [Cytobacillus kochii]
MGPALQISPIDSYIDEDVMIKVTGCSADAEVRIKAITYDEKGKMFYSYARFVANNEGDIDVTSQKPMEGTYNEVDGSGLFWSMKHADSKLDDYYEKSNMDKVTINLFLIVNGEEVDSLTIFRYFYKSGIKKEDIQFEEVKGTLFRPESQGKYPAIIILSGSDGGSKEHAAALLASKGYITLALSYFGEVGVPKDLEHIPLEYFQKATIWLQEHPFVKGKVSLIGYSRGGELALLLGATFDYYKSVIACAPSAYVTAGMKNGIFAPIPSWTLEKRPLPYIRFKYRFSTMFTLLKNWILKQPISYLSIWDNTLNDEDGIRESRIPVENIKAPVMFISGEDDQLWPSARYVKMMEEKFKHAKNNSSQNRYLYYKGAGNFLSFPYSFVNLPANVLMNVGGGMTMTFGGTKSTNAAAAKDSWRKILDFLNESKDV